MQKLMLFFNRRRFTSVGDLMQKMSATNLAVAPLPFIRFNKICLDYESGSRPVAEKCQLVDRQLQFFRPARKDSPNLILFSGIISRKEKYFGDPTMLLAYVQHQLLPIFESTNRYTFAIDFHSASLTASNTIALLLKIPQTIYCSTLEIQIYGVYRLFDVPVEAISNWFNRPPNDDESFERKHFESVNGPSRDRALRNCHLNEVLFFKKISFHKNNNVR